MSRRSWALAYLTASRCTPPEALRIARDTGYDFVGLRPWPNVPGAPYQRILDDPAMLRETLAPWTAVPDSRAALRVINLAGRPQNAGILVDALHFGRSRTSLQDIRALLGSCCITRRPATPRRACTSLPNS